MVLCDIEDFLLDIYPYVFFVFRWIFYPITLITLSLLVSTVIITPVMKVIGRWCIQKAIRLEKRSLLKALSKDYLTYELKEEESISYLNLTIFSLLLGGCWCYLL